MTTKLCHSKSSYKREARPCFPMTLSLASAILQQYGSTCLTATHRRHCPLSQGTCAPGAGLSLAPCCPAANSTSSTSAETTAPCYAIRKSNLVSSHLHLGCFWWGYQHAGRPSWPPLIQTSCLFSWHSIRALPYITTLTPSAPQLHIV